MAKNLILAGVKELTLLDHEQVRRKNDPGCLLISYTNNCLSEIRDMIGAIYGTYN